MLAKIKKWWQDRQNQIVSTHQSCDAKLLLINEHGSIIEELEYCADLAIINTGGRQFNWFWDGDDIANAALDKLYQQKGFFIDTDGALISMRHVDKVKLLRRKFKFSVTRSGRIVNREYIDKDYV